jgi:hypothetical protein
MVAGLDILITQSADNPVARPREYFIHLFFPLFLIGNGYIPYGTAPEIEDESVFWDERPCPVRYPSCLFSFSINNKNAGTQVVAAEFRPAGMDRADAFVGFPVPEEGAGNGFLLRLSQRTEEVLFIRIHGNDTYLTIRIPYPEFAGTDLLPYADDLSHGAATVTAALAYKCHIGTSLFCWLTTVNG